MSLPAADCLVVAVTTPVTRDFTPDIERLSRRCATLIGQGCDGVTLFGTTGEGAEFSVAHRTLALEAVARDIDPGRIIVSAGALPIPDIVALARHACDQKSAGVLLMPPCVYRGGITEDGTFRFYANVIERIARDGLRLYLYHFPDICGAPITPNVVRRLDERHPGIIAGVKDSGGDADFTEALLRRFSHLSIFTGTEIHVPQVMASGARGTICGLANVMPRLLRAMFDLPSPFERRKLIPHILAGDSILCRGPFIPSAKSVVADAEDDPEWRRVIPPMAELPMIEGRRLVEDFRRWDAALPTAWRSLERDGDEADTNIVALRRNG